MKNKRIHKVTITIGIVLFFAINFIRFIRVHGDMIKENLLLLVMLIFWILADIFMLVKVIYLHRCKKEDGGIEHVKKENNKIL